MLIAYLFRWSSSSFNTGTANGMLVLFSLLVTFVWWAKGFSNVSMEDNYFHWATLRFSPNSSNTVVKCSSTSSIRHMTRNNESHRVGHFFTGFFPASCIRCTVALHDLFTFFTIASTLFTLAICWCSFKNIHNQLQHKYKATWMLPTDKCFVVIYLTYISYLLQN